MNVCNRRGRIGPLAEQEEGFAMISDEVEHYRALGRELEAYLRPATFPLAIKLVESESEIPPESKRPGSDLDLRTFICQNFRMSRSYGWTIAATEEDCSCKFARAVYGWDPMTEESTAWGNQFALGLYAKDVETAEKFSEHHFVFDNKYAGLVISPLTRTKVEPDIVQIYCLPAQAMRMIQSYLFFEGGVLDFSSAGRSGSCHEGVIKTFTTDLPQLVLLGNGDRVWGGAEDAEVMFAIPKSKLELIVEGLKHTHAAGLRYPIPKYMNYEPGFQESFEQKAMDRAGSTIVKEK
jgi:uncharacterized protein (DUF169 family)